MQHSSVGGIDERRANSQPAKLSGENQRGDNFAASMPSVSMPKGGGAIRGMGEKFAANPVTGTGSLSVPVPVSPGRQGFGPQLSLSYDSGAGNGPFGFGWNLSIPSITRKTDKGLPLYRDAEESDAFILSGAEDLVPVLVEVGGKWQRETLPSRTVDGQEYQIQRYRPRTEGLFARIERWTNRQSGETHWRSISKDNITTLYGKLHDSHDATRGAQPRIADPTDSSRVFSWLICETFDDKGNWIVYQYAAENSDEVDESQAHERNRVGSRGANRYIKRILYGNQASRLLQSDQRHAKWLFEVVFDYGEHADNTPRPPVTQKWLPRTDSFSSFRAGFEVRTYRLCQRVLMFHHIPDGSGGHASNPGYDGLVRSTDFTYEANDTTTYNFLKQVTQVAYRRHDHDDGYETKTLPPVDFQYSPISIDSEVQAVDAESLENLPYGLDGSRYQWVDLEGEGLTGILTKQAEGWFYKRNISPITREPRDGKTTTQARFQPLQLLAKRPLLSTLEPGGHQFLDLAGDGQLDLVQFARPLAGFYERTDESGWENFTPFESLPNIDWSDSNLRFVDLTGDGHADVLLTEDGAFTWHPSLGEVGFGPAERVGQAIDEERGPRLVFADGTQSIYLADMSGDGLNDIVRVRNGEVCYWPNLGYGSFGTKVTMGGSLWFDHPEMFDQRRVRLADIDGSGTTDIIYLKSNRVDLYFNQCGNSFSLPTPLASFPRIDNLSSVQTADLLGTGTACLVWSSPLPGDTRSQMRYVNLIGEQKPHLLTRVVNNLGAETVIRYAPSTQFYLEDEFAGQPWITRLPFPVHVVERVETLDRVSRNRFVTRYRYHHGYFDGEEREFRGFGMVEQFDTEELSVLTDADVDFQMENSDPATHVSPIHIKTWFHTGVYIDGEKISRHLAHEYYGAPKTESEAEWKKFEAQLLPDTILPANRDNLTAHEEREACRALKGSILRQEVYALDESTKARLPYSVSERNYTLEVVQPRGKNPHAVFFSHPCETIDYHYERNLDDPRIGHSFVLKVDPFGNIERSAAIGYGRDPANVTLTEPDDRTKQITTLATVEEHDFTKAIDLADVWRTPLPCEARSFELTGPSVVNAKRISFETIEKLARQSPTISYEQATDPTKVEKRLIEHVRTLYRSDDLTKLLPLGEIMPLALPGESYKLALTPNLVTRIFETRVTNPPLIEGKYVHTKDRNGVEDANWWIPSGRIFYHPTASDNAAELDEARKHFFLPRRTRDPFGFESFVDYDTPNDLVAIHTKDALENETSAEIDYRVLQPKLVTDPNGNQVAASFDILGLVAGTAVMGRHGEGDSLTDFKPDLTDDQRTAFFIKPRLPRDVKPYPGTPLLKGATTRIIYDVDRFRREGKPTYAATLARETHDADELGVPSKLQVTFSYSDGFGREIQKKIQAEPGPLVEAGPNVDPRWVASGWTVFNNKGKPVRQYEPYFSDTHEFEFGKKVGVSPVLFYDPAERVVATLSPDNTYSKVVFNPWQQTTYDANDTVAANGTETGDPRTDADIKGYVVKYFASRPPLSAFKTWHEARIGGALGPHEQKAAKQTEVHANTPSVVHLDTLGRPFLTVAYNKFQRTGASGDEKHESRVELDIEGNQREAKDAQGRIVMRYDYDMLGNKLRQDSMEAGRRWTLLDVVGKPIRAWDDRGFERRMEYDKLHRPTKLFVIAGSAKRLAEETVYGESKPAAESTYHRGKVWKVFDDAGVVENEKYDFKGNLLKSHREFRTGYKQPANWAPRPGAPIPELLTGEKFTTLSEFDALNRLVQQTTPDNSVTMPRFSEANLLDAVDVWLHGDAAATSFVRNIDYNAKGQRTRIEYNSDAVPIVTEYKYDDATFRLINLKTVRPRHPVRGERLLQDLTYTYDPAGNITHIQDDAQQVIFFQNHRVEPSNDYIYDSVYRLIEATGREHLGQNAAATRLPPTATSYNDKPRVGLLHPGDGNAMGIYREMYDYDEVGNFKTFNHQGTDPSNPGWKRSYHYLEKSLIEPDRTNGVVNNRLSRTILNPDGLHPQNEDYTHDEHGSMTSMTHLQVMEWDFKDQLQMTQRQAVNADDEDGVLHQGERTYYVYDSTGQRVRKVTEPAGVATTDPKPKNERLYVGELEVYRDFETDGTVKLERETVHVMDDKQRVAIVETRTVGTEADVPRQLIRYQFANQLSSASLELDHAAEVITYEEYYPYGSTSYQAGRTQVEVKLKRYRFTGKERDGENGFNYHEARYYVPWLGRWSATDPLGLKGTTTLYSYCDNAPVGKFDPDGREPYDPQSGHWFRKLLLYGRDTPILDALTSNRNLQNAEKTIAVATIGTLVTLATGGAAAAAGATAIEAGAIGGGTGSWFAVQHNAAIEGRTPTLAEAAVATTAGMVMGGGFAAVETKIIPAIVSRTVPKPNVSGANHVGAWSQTAQKNVPGKRNVFNPPVAPRSSSKPITRDDNCVACVGAVVRRSEDEAFRNMATHNYAKDVDGGTGGSAHELERMIGSVARTEGFSIPKAINWLQQATGKTMSAVKLGQAGFLKGGELKPGHYAIFGANPKGGHVIYGNVGASGKVSLFDPQIGKPVNWMEFIGKFPSASAFRFGP